MRVDRGIDSKLSSGDINAFKHFFERFYPSLCMLANRYLKDEEVAMDIVQDAFVLLWSKKEIFSSFNSAKAYLFKHVKNRSLNYLRDKYSRERLIQENISSDTYFFDSLIEEETYQIIYHAIRTLSPQGQKVILLSLDGLKNNEIAEQLNVSINTVKTIKLRAFKTMRNKLDRQFFSFLLCPLSLNRK